VTQLNLDVKNFNSENFSIFFHVPKTGGTSLSEHLQKVYGPHYARLTPEKVNDKLMRDYQIMDLKAVLGHYDVNNPMYQRIHQPINHLTVLRDPVDRVVSQYYYLRQSTNHPNHEVALCHSLPEIFSKGIASSLGMVDKQVDLLSVISTSAKPRLRLNSAKYSLKNYFTFFGLYKHLDEFVEICAYNLGWPISIPFPKSNNSTRLSIEELSPGVIKLISDNNQLDRELYSYACEVYDGLYWRHQIPIETKEIAPITTTVEIISSPEEVPPKRGFWRNLYFVFFEYDLKRLVS
jgi:hypothetical protein